MRACVNGRVGRRAWQGRAGTVRTKAGNFNYLGILGVERGREGEAKKEVRVYVTLVM